MQPLVVEEEEKDGEDKAAAAAAAIRRAERCPRVPSGRFPGHTTVFTVT